MRLVSRAGDGWRRVWGLGVKAGALLLLVGGLTACASGDDAPADADTATPAPTLAAATVTRAPTQSPVPVSSPTPETTSTPAESTPTPDDYTPLERHTLGPADAALTVVMFGDFQCVACAQAARDLEILRARYPDDVRLVWRHLPDTRIHDKAALALQASEAAAAQGRFWQMHDQLFSHQANWIDLPPDDFRALLTEYAATVGLDLDRFLSDLVNATYADRVAAAQRDAAALEIVGAPQLLFNGIPYNGRADIFGYDQEARLALLAERQFEAPPEMVIDPQRSYRATLTMPDGDIVIDLFADRAPLTVNNFVFLARAGWYDEMTFHYVVPGFVAQTGDPSGTGRGGPGYTISSEADNGLVFDRAGLVAMAHPPGEPDAAGSEFFITLAPLEPRAEWDGQYTIFGEVVAGFDLVPNLTPRNANDPVNFPAPPPGDPVLRVTIEEREP